MLGGGAVFVVLIRRSLRGKIRNGGVISRRTEWPERTRLATDHERDCQTKQKILTQTFRGDKSSVLTHTSHQEKRYSTY